MPVIATGLFFIELFPYGRLAQSMAFLRTPEKLRLYSGDMIIMPSADFRESFRLITDVGGLFSRSSLNSGKSRLGVEKTMSFGEIDLMVPLSFLLIEVAFRLPMRRVIFI